MHKKFKTIGFVSVLVFTLSVSTVLAQGNSQNGNGQPHARVCLHGPSGEARCHARVVVDKGGTPVVTTLPAGYGPAQFLGAYNLNGISSTKTDGS